ncbi:MAG: Holliday junction branch migration protein RuvA [Proteobacteria bacterium]|nr:Holliday junction branch migration protein RuvA [Pseudomonadota bacterium]
MGEILFTSRPGGMLQDMIGRLTGNVADKNSTGVLIDVQGVGYELALPLSTLASLPSTGEIVTLFVHTHVREDDLRLFGFSTQQDRIAFRTMLKVSGVGPKLALAVIGGLSGNQLAQVIRQSDTKRLSSIPGIGKKTAERMILELGGKLKLDESGGTGEHAHGSVAELTSALKNLGFKPAQVDRVIGQIGRRDAEEQPFEVLLRNALTLLQEK